MTLKKKAEAVRKAGFKNSGKDSVLAHITPDEEKLLKMYGGSGRTDPKTGLRHYDDSSGPDGTADPGIGPPDPGPPDTADPNIGPDVPGLDTVTVTGQADPPDVGSDVMGLGFDFDENSDFNYGGVPDLAIPPDEESLLSKMFKGALPMAKGVLGLGGVPTPTSPQSPSQGLGSIMGSLGTVAGGIFGGPLGAALGGFAGNAIGNSIGEGVPSMSTGDISAANAATSDPSNSAGFDWGQLGTGLAGWYQGRQAGNAYGGAVNDINNMYSPNSPYAQQMRQALARKDAASGRRSQYGNREIELAAALTNARTQALTSPGYGNLLAKQQQGNNMGMNTFLALLQSKQGKNWMNQGGNYLSNLYSNQTGSGGTNMFEGGGSAPSYGDWMGSGGNDYQMGDYFGNA